MLVLSTDVRELLLREEQWVALERLAKREIERGGTLVLSAASKMKVQEILGKFELGVIGASWRNIPTHLPTCPLFGWKMSAEDSAENVEAYINHLLTHVQLPSDYTFVDVRGDTYFLNVELPIDQNVRGTTDVVVTKKSNVQNDAIRNNVEALLELKKPENLKRSNHHPQVIGEHLAASCLNPGHGVVSALTDLRDSWTFYWFAKDESDGGQVALYKLKLPIQDGSAGSGAALANYILVSLNDKSRRDTLPTTFADRLSFRDFAGSMSHDGNVPKRPRREPDGDDNSQDQDEKPAASRHPPPLGPGGTSTSEMTEFQNSCGNGNPPIVHCVSLHHTLAMM